MNDIQEIVDFLQQVRLVEGYQGSIENLIYSFKIIYRVE